MPNFQPAGLVLLVCLGCPGVVRAQAPPLITDRPDLTESPFVVPLGSIQLETGLTTTRDGQGRSTAGTEALIRWSPARRLELRFEPPGYAHAEATGAFTDAAIGTKLELGRVRAWSVAAIASVALPTGDSVVSAGRVVPEVVVVIGRQFGDSWSLGAQASSARPDVGGGLGQAYTLVAGRALTQRLGAFFELAAERQPGDAVDVLVHTGLTLTVSQAVQLDVHAAHGVMGDNSVGSVGVGVSTRFH